MAKAKMATKRTSTKPAAAAKAKVAVPPATTAALPAAAGLVRVLEDDGTVQKGKDPNLPKDTLLCA